MRHHSGGRCRQVVAIWRLSLTQVWLYTHNQGAIQILFGNSDKVSRHYSEKINFFVLFYMFWMKKASFFKDSLKNLQYREQNIACMMNTSTSKIINQTTFYISFVKMLFSWKFEVKFIYLLERKKDGNNLWPWANTIKYILC